MTDLAGGAKPFSGVHAGVSSSVSPALRALRVTRPAAVAIFVLLLAVGTAGRAVQKPLWHDEIFTLYIANLPSASIWNALADGVDLNPPLYHLAVSGVASLLGPTPLAVRLPALVGFLVSCLAIYAFARRRMSAWAAWVGALTPSLSGAYLYAYEGRPYGLVLGFCALALVAWQARAEGRISRAAPACCALAMAAAEYTHYYAVLMLIPLASGEIVRTLLRRRIDWPMWIAFAASAGAVAGLLPLVRSARAFAGTFWSRPAPGDLIGFYQHLLEPLTLIAVLAATLATAGWIVTRLTPVPSSPVQAESWPLPIDETIVALALVALPIGGYLLAVLVTGAFHERYVLFSVLGFSVLLAAWASAAARVRFASAAVLLVLAAAFAAKQAAGARGLWSSPPDPMAAHAPSLSRVPSRSTLVVSHALTYLPLAHYADADLRGRLVYLTRPPDVVSRTGVDTGGRALERLARYAPLDVRPYEDFVNSATEFHVYGPPSWLVPQLLADKCQVELVVQSGSEALLVVRLPSQP